MLKYYIFSDVHGEFDTLQRALKNSGFNSKDKDSYLVSLGDAFDRGAQSCEMLKWMVSNVRKGKLLTVCGNHEWRLQQLMENPSLYSREADGYCNGIIQTLMSFCHFKNITPLLKENPATFTNSNIVYSAGFFGDLVALIPTTLTMLLAEYFNSLEWGYQNRDYILVHGWYAHEGGFYMRPQDAVWANTPKCIKAKDYPADGRKLIVGHWQTEALKQVYLGSLAFEELTKPWEPSYDIFECEKFAAIDGSTNVSGQVNIYTIETDDPLVPIKY